MRIIKDSSEEEMVLAFLKAEIDSPRFSPTYGQFLSNWGLDRRVIDAANMDDARENGVRAALLDAVRGLRKKEYLFRGFPDDCVWRRVALNKEDLSKMRYAKHQTWLTLSSGSRLVTEGARNIDLEWAEADAKFHIMAIATDLRKGKRYPDLILMADNQRGDLILVEGHARATAYLREIDCLPEEIEAIVGYSDNISNWSFY